MNFFEHKTLPNYFVQHEAFQDYFQTASIPNFPNKLQDLLPTIKCHISPTGLLQLQIPNPQPNLYSYTKNLIHKNMINSIMTKNIPYKLKLSPSLTGSKTDSQPESQPSDAGIQSMKSEFINIVKK